MRSFLKITAIAAVFTATAFSANAADVDAQVTFNGLILDSCTVNVLTPGTLGSSSDQSILSSEEIGGLPATASVVTNSTNSSVQVLPPISFDVAPAGSDANTTFSTKYELTGATSLLEDVGANLAPLTLGVTAMVINASAEKSVGSYNGGNYTMVATVRCITP